MKDKVSKKAIKHLKGDMKGYRKEMKTLSEEIGEDKELIKSIKGNKMKKQGYNDRLDESIGERNKGKKKQSMKSRRDESKGMEKAEGKRSYSKVSSMDKGKGKK
jgi:hypothetical protein